LLASAGYCIQQITNNISDFFKYEVDTRVTIINEAPTNFPVVTICNMNPFLGNQTVVKFLLKEDNKSFSEMPKEYFENRVQNEFRATFFTSEAENETNLLSAQLDYILLSCRFAGGPCMADSFKLLYNYLYGQCYQFNTRRSQFDGTKEILETFKPGLI
jgi:hypothetical protein